jgi:hypothetical protein
VVAVVFLEIASVRDVHDQAEIEEEFQRLIDFLAVLSGF